MVIVLENINMGLASGIGLVAEAIDAYKKPDIEAVSRELNGNNEQQWVLDEASGFVKYNTTWRQGSGTYQGPESRDARRKNANVSIRSVAAADDELTEFRHRKSYT